MDHTTPPDRPESSLVIHNRHAKSCGEFPAWATYRAPQSYFGYFESELGDQWVFVATADGFKFAGGDCGWDKTHEISAKEWPETKIEKTERGVIHLCGTVLGEREAIWLTACIAAAARRFADTTP